MRKIAIALALSILMFAPPRVFAHAFPDHAEPAIGGTVSVSPSELKIWFTQKLEPAFSKLEVRDQTGAEVDKGDARVDGDDASLLRVSLPALKPGTYKVNWHVVSVDTHPTEGDFTFTVK